MKTSRFLTLVCILAGFPALAQEHLWDKEPSLWNVAQSYKLVRTLPAQFGVEGPATDGLITAQVTAANPQGAPGINLSNGKLKVSLWGPPNKLTLSISKTDVYDRTSPHPGVSWTYDEGHSPRPVGQLLLMAEDFSGASQPEVTTSINNGLNTFAMTNSDGTATANLGYFSSRSNRNVLVIKAAYTGLTKPVLVRLFSFSPPGHESPLPNHDGYYFWLRQTLPAEKTFPNGFDYYFVARIVGPNVSMDADDEAKGLGASTFGRDLGSAATAKILPNQAGNFVVYATVVTSAESNRPLDDAKKRLDAAASQGVAALVNENQAWYQAMYSRRELGRIFTGDFNADLKDILMPFFYQGSWQNRHTYMSCPDPSKYEGDGNYAGLEADTAPWQGLPCFNEELYTGDFVAARDESIAPYYVTLVNFWRKAWEKHAADAGLKGMYFMRGYVPPILNDVYFSYDPDAMSGCDWGSMCWCYKNVWNEFDYGGRDNVFLRDSVYPGLKDIADFFASLVVMGNDGYYHIDHSLMRENELGSDAMDCIASAKWFWKTAIEASEILNVDPYKRAAWQGYLNKIHPYYRMPDGTLGGIVQNGQVRQYKMLQHFIVNETDEYNLESSPADQETAYNSTDHTFLGADIPHLLGRDRDTFNGGVAYWYWMFNRHPWLMYYAIKKMGIEINSTIALDTPLKKTVACWFEPERLCNSRSGTIFFFPAVPSNFDVAFRDFQARGGFLVTGEQKDGKVTYVSVTARRTTVCAVINPWPDQSLSVLQQPENIPVRTVNSGLKYRFMALAGKSYLLQPAPKQSVQNPT